MSNIFGMHDYSPVWADMVVGAGRTAWCVNTEGIGRDPNDMGSKQYDDHGGRITHIARLNCGYGTTGTIPLPQYYGDFAQRCANFAKGTNAKYFVVANEICLEWERPDGQEIKFEDYIRCYNLVYEAIKAVRPDALISPQAHGTWNPATRYPENPSGDWCLVVKHQLERIVGCEWIALHAYAHYHDPQLIYSNEKMGNPEFSHRHYHWRVLQDQLAEIPERFRHLPVIVTEANGEESWKNENNGFLQAMYADVDHWNKQSGNQQVAGVCIYRWPCNLDGLDRGVECKQGVIDDFRQSLNSDYQWTERSVGTLIGNAVASTSVAPDSNNSYSVARVARFRNAPNGDVITNLEVGTPISVTGNVASAGDLTWWEIVVNGQPGWMARADKAGNVLITESEGFVRVEKVVAEKSVMWVVNAARLRATPGGDVLGTLPSRTSVILHGEKQESGGLTWQKVSTFVPGSSNGSNGLVGWVAEKTGDGTILIERNPLQVGSPTDGIYPLTQMYGENPETYQTIRLQKPDGSWYGLSFHNGLDYGLPTGTTIKAIDAGTVARVGFDAGGYGNFVEITHDWGASIYCHLNQVFMTEGVQVERGNVLGKSGNTGRSSGPHLHFAVQIKPFDWLDGVLGYCDPLSILPWGHAVIPDYMYVPAS